MARNFTKSRMETEKQLKQEPEQDLSVKNENQPESGQDLPEKNENQTKLKQDVPVTNENQSEQQAEPEEPAVKKAVTQDEILLAALKLFAEKGYFNTSLTDISKRVGATTTSKIYQHFKNKQAIAELLYDTVLDSLSCSIDDIRRRNPKASEQLREIVDLLFSLTDEAPEIMHFLLVLNVREILPEAQPIHQTAPFVKINKILNSGIKDNEIRSADAQQAFTYFFGVVFHTITLILSGVLLKTAESYQSNTWVTAWNAISKK